MGTIASDDLTWNAKTELSETELTESTVTLEMDEGPDSNYLLVMRNTATKPYSGSVQAGDFWMKDQGSVDFDVTSSTDVDHAIGPFESGRVMDSNSQVTVEMEAGVTLSNVVASFVKVPKP